MDTPLWAAYLEMTHGDGSERARLQWILMPPVPTGLVPDLKRIDNPFLFHRRQDRLDHRSAWRCSHLSTRVDQSNLTQSITDWENKGWVSKPLVTCQVDPLEMRDIVRDGYKTPWRVLTRIDRVSFALHNYKVL